MKVRRLFFILSFLGIVLGISSYYFYQTLWPLGIISPIVFIGLIDAFQNKQAIRRNFPVIGNFRYMLEGIRPEIMQYFVETDTEGRPIDRIMRSLIYQRSKGVRDTRPFGTQNDVYEVGYEWMPHSIYATDKNDIDKDPRILVGGKDCLKPYSCSVLNISAMSFGSLSNRAVLAMNKGAKHGGFAHNTGEGGISPYHLEPGGDLIWQIGTGYFGCRNEDGTFSPEMFAANAKQANVKMIELKISQGAKPGHGGILPAAKNTEEIAKIRGVKPGISVHSPPGHKAFNDANGLCNFIKTLRDLSGGKPVGFKLCIGKPEEFEKICLAMVETGISPDFISIDGGEGGTGAAPVEFANSIGMPLREGLHTANTLLKKYDLKKDIKIIASGKIISAFHMIRVFALGADICNSARGMMMAVGCIQALECNSNSCPVGVATQNQQLVKGINVDNKADRVASYHQKTIKALTEMVAAAGLKSQDDITTKHIYRRITMNEVKTYHEIYPS